MNRELINKHNEKQFLVDLKSVRDVLAYSPETGAYFRLLKREVLEEAQRFRIRYIMTNKVFSNGRTVMVIV